MGDDAGEDASGDAGVGVHAGCVVVGEAGILIRGPSGSGKSALARHLVAHARRLGAFARLVADDRVRLAPRGGRVVARPHPVLAGLVELRGLGLVAVADAAPAAIVRLVVDLAPQEAPFAQEAPGAPPERLPPDPLPTEAVAGIALPRLGLARPRGGVGDLAADLAGWLTTWIDAGTRAEIDPGIDPGIAVRRPGPDRPAPEPVPDGSRPRRPVAPTAAT